MCADELVYTGLVKIQESEGSGMTFYSQRIFYPKILGTLAFGNDYKIGF